MLVHTGQHYDDELSRGVLRRAGDRPARPRDRDRLGHARPADRRACWSAWSRCWSPSAPTWCWSTATPTRRWRARWSRSRRAIALAHVEAGLRSYDRTMPEEVNRVVTDVVADLRFCPSQTAVDNLAAEGIRERRPPGRRRDGRRGRGVRAGRAAPLRRDRAARGDGRAVLPDHRSPPGQHDGGRRWTRWSRSWRPSGAAGVPAASRGRGRRSTAATCWPAPRRQRSSLRRWAISTSPRCWRRRGCA